MVSLRKSGTPKNGVPSVILFTVRIPKMYIMPILGYFERYDMEKECVNIMLRKDGGYIGKFYISCDNSGRGIPQASS